MTTDKNRYVAEKLGLCWHETVEVYDELVTRRAYTEKWNKCSCGRSTLYPEKCNSPNPDFSADGGAVQLLRLMEKNERYGEFVRFINGIEEGSLQDPRYDPLRYLIDTYYIITRGKLLDAAYGWFKEREGERK